MPDISMCKNDTCPLKKSCYRFMATPGMRQSYSVFEYKIINDNHITCDGFMSNNRE